MDQSRIDKALQFALAVAARADDPFDRELGPIHLIKYVYLADLAYALKHAGSTYTGAPWRFYKFGPWCEDVRSRIEPAIQGINAEVRTFEWGTGDEAGEGLRYKVPQDDGVLAALENDLDFLVASAIKKAVKEFYAATPELLRHVYLTLPMLRAAPFENLDFTPLEQNSTESVLPSEPTAKQLKKQREILKRAQSSVQSKLAEYRSRKKGKSPLTPQPRYDELYSNGVKWLESLAGQELPEEGELQFSDDLWKSRSRFDPDLS